MRNDKYLLSLLAVLLIVCSPLQAQRRNTAYNNYIKEYADLAVDQMKRYKIPASITLSQGLLESGAGQSSLAKRSNNHFGIKCGNNWTGRSVRANDDAPNECFRAYSNVRASYEDHSKFLTQNRRYASLFNLKQTDYRGWAQGLKKAGYATDKSYATKLISIIEDYELYKYDSKTKTMSKREERRWQKELKKKPWLANPHDVYIANGIAYVIARDGDTFDLLSGEFRISKRKLVKYNELEKSYTLMDGDIIYLNQKNKKWEGSQIYHEVRDGDSMHSIAQIYGVQLKSLYKLNRLKANYVPEVGDRIFLK